MKTESDEASYLGCVTPLGLVPSLRTPTSGRRLLRCAREPFGSRFARRPNGLRLLARAYGPRLRFLGRTPGRRRRATIRLTRAVWLRSAPPRCARRPPVGACASSGVRRAGGGERRYALLGLSGFARLRLAARADLRSALALPRAYAGQEAESDDTPYSGCLASLGSASLRAPTSGRRLRFLGRTPGRRRRATIRLTRAV